MNFIRQSSLLVVTWALVAPLTGGCAMFWETPGTPLAEAAHRGDPAAIRTLVAAGANVHAFDESGHTALHWAARGGHRLGPHRCRGETSTRPEVVAALLDAGADVNATDRRRPLPGASSGWTPLHLALHHEQFATARLLLQRGADPNIRSHQGRSVMALASEEGAPRELLQDLLAHGFDPQRARVPTR